VYIFLYSSGDLDS